MGWLAFFGPIVEAYVEARPGRDVRPNGILAH